MTHVSNWLSLNIPSKTFFAQGPYRPYDHKSCWFADKKLLRKWERFLKCEVIEIDIGVTGDVG